MNALTSAVAGFLRRAAQRLERRPPEPPPTLTSTGTTVHRIPRQRDRRSG